MECCRPGLERGSRVETLEGDAGRDIHVSKFSRRREARKELAKNRFDSRRCGRSLCLHRINLRCQPGEANHLAPALCVGFTVERWRRGGNGPSGPEANPKKSRSLQDILRGSEPRHPRPAGANSPLAEVQAYERGREDLHPNVLDKVRAIPVRRTDTNELDEIRERVQRGADRDQEHR